MMCSLLTIYQLGIWIVQPSTELMMEMMDNRLYLVGGIPTPLKNISQIGSSSQLLGEIKNVPNHQPDIITMDRT